MTKTLTKTFWAAAGLLSLAAAATVSQPALAKGAHPAKAAHHGGGKIAKLAQRLGLSDAQKAQLKPILKSRRQQVKAIRQDATLTPNEQRARIKALRQSDRPEILAVLTPEQKAKLAQMRHEHRGQRK